MQEIDYSISPRMVPRSARTPVLTSDDCPGLTEIKNVRIRNNLLEEIFNVEDSIELDYFELERQEANFNSYLSGYTSPSSTRLSFEPKPENTGKGSGVEGNGYQLHELQSRRLGTKDSAPNVNQSNGLAVKYENGGHELVAVASPTISSTCEGGTTGSVATGVGHISSMGSPAAVPVSDTTSVHSTTNAAGHDAITSADGKTAVASKNQWNGQEVGKIPAIVAETVVQDYNTSTRENVRPRPESRHRNNTTTTEVSGLTGSCAEDISGDPTGTNLNSSGGQGVGGDSTAASSSSTSPSQLHVTKRQRVIDCGSDLLAEVRQAYEYVQGADLYAPSSHPTFTNLNVPSTFQPNTDQNGQPAMNFNFSGQTGGGGGVPVAFVGRSQMGVGTMPSTPQSAGVAYIGGRRSNTASPSHITYHQSCPDLASPGRQPVPEAVTYPRFLQQRSIPNEEAVASFSAPTTPSKRAGPWSANAQHHLRSPMSPSLQTQWRSAAPVSREPPGMLVHHQNNGQNTTPYVPQDAQRCYDAVGYSPYVQRLEQYNQPQSPHMVAGPGRSVYQNSNQCRPHYGLPPAHAFPRNTQMPVARPATMSDTNRLGDGVPLSQNAFLRSVVDDENAVFRSHPLFPLLRDIIIADMNFHTPSFPFQLIANLPINFNRLVDNYMQRNPHLSSLKVSDSHAESVVMDALAYAHAALIGESLQ